MNAVWTRAARGHLRAVHDHIAARSPRNALRVVDRITRRTEQLASFPLLGAEVPEYGDESVREVFEHPYRIIYRVRADRVDVLVVTHAARPLPPDPPAGVAETRRAFTRHRHARPSHRPPRTCRPRLAVVH